MAKLGVIAFEQDAAVDELLSAVARQLMAQGFKVAGFIQQAEDKQGQCCGAVNVEAVATGMRWQIMQPLGRHAHGCRLDPNALAEVAMEAKRQIGQGADIVILNRFGKGEADGGGLRCVFEAACLAGIPILTSVKELYLPAWNEFAGDLALCLPAQFDSIMGWARQAATRKVGSHAA